jgi:hypothetical protein
MEPPNCFAAKNYAWNREAPWMLRGITDRTFSDSDEKPSMEAIHRPLDTELDVVRGR